ncbi:hypothetical protein BAU15_07410 [Enterococcus sp. JM4C]|nr:hypothetical protein BAU15_07410 [Enterococcus sp. JM4C]
MKVALCDDEPIWTQQVEEILESYGPVHFDVEIYYDPQKLLLAIKETSYDFFFLDIEMPGLSGLDLAREIRKNNSLVPIIFLTSYKEYMPEVFALQTFDYVMKPVTKEAIFPVLNRIMNYLQVQEKGLHFSYKKIDYFIEFRKIIYFEKDKRSVLINTTEGQYTTILKTDELMKRLDKRFVRVHNSYIINCFFISKLENEAVWLRQQDESPIIPVSRNYSKSARAEIVQQLKEIM